MSREGSHRANAPSTLCELRLSQGNDFRTRDAASLVLGGRVLVLCSIVAAVQGCNLFSRTPSGSLNDSPAVEHRALTIADGTVLRYSMLSPSHAGVRSARLPLILVLHYGAPHDSTPPFYGEQILERLVRPALGKLSAIFVAPDAPGRGWADAHSESAVLTLLDHLRTSMPIDEHRILIVGYSVGGMGTWYFVARHPELFAGAIAIASFPMLREGRTAVDRETQLRAMALDTSAAWTTPFRRVPMYLIHSRQDELMAFSAVDQAVAALCAHGGHVEFVALDSVAHGQTSSYVEPLSSAIPWIERQLSLGSGAQHQTTLRPLSNERCS
jgi:predicted esterase